MHHSRLTSCCVIAGVPCRSGQSRSVTKLFSDPGDTMSVTKLDSLVHRLDEARSNIPNPHGVPVTLFANRDVPVELEAIEQALGFVDVQGTIDDIWQWERAGRTGAFWGDEVGRLERVVLTPDLHRGGGIPVGTVGEA